MHIFIDESGNFVIPKAKKSKISCVTALTIPDKHLDSIIKSFTSIRKSWGYENEIKGNKLTETQTAKTIALLRSYDVLLDIICLDVGHHTKDGIEKFKTIQANKLIEHLTDKHHKNLIKQLYEYRARLLKLPNQLFIQAFISILLIERVLTHSTLYYCQKIPEELGNFIWHIDAKDRSTGKTPFEELWSTLLMPILQTNYCMVRIIEGDYSHFKKYEVPTKDMTEHQKTLMTNGSTGGFDITKLIKEQLYFEDSVSHVGIQLVDIMSSTFTRAMNGNLKPKGWQHLGALMVKEPQIVLLDTDLSNKPVLEDRHSLVVIAMRNNRKPLLT
jgi:hypothetical protein